MSDYWDHPDVEINELVGKTITAIEGGKESDELKFTCSDGSKYVMYHSQSCCESVDIEDIVGDLEDLIGNPLLQAEEVVNSGSGSTDYDKEENDPSRITFDGTWPDEVPKPTDYAPESYTWTFYKFATIKGSVTIRWYGTSNGYYSETVSIARTDIKREGY